jgi:iron complex transport system substrate-binding protein
MRCPACGEAGRHDLSCRPSLKSKAFALRAPGLRALGMVLLLLAGSSGATAAAQATLRDDRGTILAWTRPPQRIVSLLPSLTESLCALGGCTSLVGVDDYSNWPAAVAALPRLGGLDDARLERIVALKPELVLATPGARVIERLEALGIPVMVLHSRNHADVHRTLGLLAVMLGRPEEGERAWARIEREFAEAAKRVPSGLRGQRVYFEVGAPYAAGTASFIGETLARLGMGNIVPAELGPFPNLNPEFVVRAQPDIVMAVDREIAAMPRRPGWEDLVALRNKRTCAFAADRYELLVRPGPRMGEAALAIGDCLAALGAR